MAYSVGKILALSSCVLAGSVDILADGINLFPDFFWTFISAVGIVVMNYIFGNVDTVPIEQEASRKSDVVAAGEQHRSNKVFVCSP